MNVCVLNDNIRDLIRIFGIRQADVTSTDEETLVHLRQPGSDRALFMLLRPCGEKGYECKVSSDVAVVVCEVEVSASNVLLFASQVILLNESMSRGVIWPIFEYDGYSR